MPKQKKRDSVDFAAGIEDMSLGELKAEVVQLRMASAAGIDKETWDLIQKLGEAIHQPQSREWRARVIEMYYLLIDMIERK